jgi:peptide deformylase
MSDVTYEVIPEISLKLSPPEEVENVVCEEVNAFEIPEILQTIKPAMEEILKKYKGIGLAAPQVGIKKKFFIILNSEDGYDIYFNPQYYMDSNVRIQTNEGCLTYEEGKKHCIMKRWKNVTCISYVLNNDKLVKKTFKLKGLSSISFQHEKDHLDGRTIFMK